MIYLALSPSDKKHSIQHKTAHALLHSLLKSLGYGEVAVKTEENGRPYCEIEGLDFSLSHSGNTVAVCIISDREADIDCTFSLPYSGKKVGIDLEEIKNSFDIQAKNKLAQRFLGKCISSKDEFYRLWTRNEAYGKMTGEGVICKKDVSCETLSFMLEYNNSSYSMSIAFC